LFRLQIAKATQLGAEYVKCDQNDFVQWIEAAIQGRSGYPWVDAILNSPLDVDKLDYVFRDCDFLDQETHISKDNRSKWVDNLFNHTRVLPSGLVALSGDAGEQARDFLEERRWLYKHQYFQSGYRALERLAGAVTLQWLLHHVADAIVGSEWHVKVLNELTSTVSDTSARKGLVARELLWRELRVIEKRKTKPPGEPGLLLKLAHDLTQTTPKGLPSSDRVSTWAKRCEDIFRMVFERDWKKVEPGHFTLLHFLTHDAGITCSEAFYVSFEDLSKVREIIRELETLSPFRAVFDIALMPRMLSYPSRRRSKWHGETILGECFAVAHKDPDRWGMTANRWIPMSDSAFAERDKKRWAKVMVISAEPQDPTVVHAVDRFRALCHQKEIEIRDVDPDEALG